MTKGYIESITDSMHQANLKELAVTKKENDRLAKDLRKLISEARQAITRGKYVTPKETRAVIKRIESAEETLAEFSKVREARSYRGDL